MHLMQDLSLLLNATVLEYQKNIQNQLRSQVGFQRSTYQTIVPGHVGMWTLRKK